jgi:hypothetical protein
MITDFKENVQMIKKSKMILPVYVVMSIFLFSTFAIGGATKTEGDIYVVTIAKKAKGKASVQITPKKGYHCNMEYPWKIILTPPAGVKLAKAKYKKTDASTFTEQKVLFVIPLQAKSVTGQIKMSVCDEKQCYMKKASITLPAK